MGKKTNFAHHIIIISYHEKHENTVVDISYHGAVGSHIYILPHLAYTTIRSSNEMVHYPSVALTCRIIFWLYDH